MRLVFLLFCSSVSPPFTDLYYRHFLHTSKSITLLYHMLFTSSQTASASSAGISTIPIPVGWTVSYGCIIILCCRSWQNDFSNGRSQIIAWIAISRLEKSRRTTSDGSLQAQTYLTALFSCQRTVRLLSACINSFLQMDWYRMIRKSGTGKRGVC